MIAKFPVVQAMGERAILIQFEAEISEKLLEKLLFYKNELQKKYIKEEVEVINTYDSLLISYMYDIEDVYGEISAVKQLFRKAKIDKKTEHKLFYIPVCYDLDFGWDLDFVCQEKNLTHQELIELHTAPVYTVFFLGFLPGFLYLGGLEKSLHISRKNQPRLKVEKGAVGIGEKQTGIYPKTSPGGWQIIGKSPLSFFNVNDQPPTKFSAGDKIKFYSISKQEFFEIQAAVQAGNFQIKSENDES